MPAPQPGILMEENAHALYLVLRAKRGTSPRALIKACAEAPALTATMARHYPKAALRCTIAYGRGLLADGAGWPTPPAHLADLKPIHSKAGDVPRTPADVLFHIGSARHDLNFALARELLAAVGDRAEVVDEVAGFRYLETRDLTGFMDGTANPKGRERAEAGLIGPEDRGFAGGSYVLIQRFVHDLDAWSRLSLKRQEAAIGRTKTDSVELAGRKKLPTARASPSIPSTAGGWSAGCNRRESRSRRRPSGRVAVVVSARRPYWWISPRATRPASQQSASRMVACSPIVTAIS